MTKESGKGPLYKMIRCSITIFYCQMSKTVAC